MTFLDSSTIIEYLRGNRTVGTDEYDTYLQAIFSRLV